MKKGERTREAILHNAARLFERKGYFSTSIDDIAGSLRIAKGAMYQYFRDKRELFEVLVENAVQRLLASYERVGAEASGLRELVAGLFYETSLFSVVEYDYFTIYMSAGSAFISSMEEAFSPLKTLAIKIESLLDKYREELRAETYKASLSMIMYVNTIRLVLMEFSRIPREQLKPELIRAVCDEFADLFLSGFAGGRK